MGGYGRIFVDDLHVAATRADLRLAPTLVDSPNDFERAFAAMSKFGAQAMIVQALFDPYQAILLELAAKHRLALMLGSREATAAGGLVSISNYLFLYERAAFYVDKILKGTKPADLPVEQPTKFQVTLNMKTAQALGLAVSPSLLSQVDEVID
jgi:putative tryptophan/tyrosine transport system substrate-binding protein